MKVVVDEQIRAPVDAVQEAYLDPAFYERLGRLPGIDPPRLRSLSRSEGRVQAVVGSRFAGQLNGAARRILDPSRLSWAQVSEVDLASRRTTLTMVPDNYGQLLSFCGWYELVALGDDRCRQHLEADLRVHVPLLGPLAERAIAGSIRENLAGTARALESYVAGL